MSMVGGRSFRAISGNRVMVARIASSLSIFLRNASLSFPAAFCSIFPSLSNDSISPAIPWLLRSPATPSRHCRYCPGIERNESNNRNVETNLVDRLPADSTGTRRTVTNSNRHAISFETIAPNDEPRYRLPCNCHGVLWGMDTACGEKKNVSVSWTRGYDYVGKMRK